MQGVRDDGVLPASAWERERLALIRALAEGGLLGLLQHAAAARLGIAVRLKRLFAGVASRRGHGAGEPSGADGSPHDFARLQK